MSEMKSTRSNKREDIEEFNRQLMRSKAHELLRSNHASSITIDLVIEELGSAIGKSSNNRKLYTRNKLIQDVCKEILERQKKLLLRIDSGRDEYDSFATIYRLITDIYRTSSHLWFNDLRVAFMLQLSSSDKQFATMQTSTRQFTRLMKTWIIGHACERISKDQATSCAMDVIQDIFGAVAPSYLFHVNHTILNKYEHSATTTFMRYWRLSNNYSTPMDPDPTDAFGNTFLD